jgi:hypothetical protein
MKDRLLIIIGIIIEFTLFVTDQSVQGLCTPEMFEDWPDYPCGPVELSPEKQRDLWQGYYQFKGQEWMESKKQEMSSALKNGTLAEWSSISWANQNVRTYYTMNNEFPSMIEGYVTSQYENLESQRVEPQSESNMAVNYFDFKNIPESHMEKICYGDCELQRAQLIALIGIAIASLISIPVVLFNRKRK